MSGERTIRGEMESSRDRLTDLAVRVALLSAQRPADAAQYGSMAILPPTGSIQSA